MHDFNWSQKSKQAWSQRNTPNWSALRPARGGGGVVVQDTTLQIPHKAALCWGRWSRTSLTDARVKDLAIRAIFSLTLIWEHGLGLRWLTFAEYRVLDITVNFASRSLDKSFLGFHIHHTSSAVFRKQWKWLKWGCGGQAARSGLSGNNEEKRRSARALSILFCWVWTLGRVRSLADVKASCHLPRERERWKVNVWRGSGGNTETQSPILLECTVKSFSAKSLFISGLITV